MQFFILFIGAMVFVFYLFVQPPVLFQQIELKRIAKLSRIPAACRRRISAPSTVASRPPWRWREAHRAGDTPGVIREQNRVPRGAGRARRRARRRRQTRGEHGRRKGLQRHQLHLSLVRHPLSAVRHCRARHRRHLRRHHVGQFRRNQLTRHRHRHRYLPAPLQDKMPATGTISWPPAGSPSSGASTPWSSPAGPSASAR